MSASSKSPATSLIALAFARCLREVSQWHWPAFSIPFIAEYFSISPASRGVPRTQETPVEVLGASSEKKQKWFLPPGLPLQWVLCAAHMSPEHFAQWSSAPNLSGHQAGDEVGWATAWKWCRNTILLNYLRRAVLGITDPRMQDAVEDSSTSEARRTGGEDFLPAHAGQESCPRVAALMYTRCQHEQEGEDWVVKNRLWKQGAWVSWFHCRRVPALGQSHWIRERFRLEGAIKGHLVQRPCNDQGHLQLDQVSQSPLQPDLECFQGWGICSLSGQPVPAFHHLQEVVQNVRATKCVWDRNKMIAVDDRNPTSQGAAVFWRQHFQLRSVTESRGWHRSKYSF